MKKTIIRTAAVIYFSAMIIIFSVLAIANIRKNESKLSGTLSIICLIISWLTILLPVYDFLNGNYSAVSLMIIPAVATYVTYLFSKLSHGEKKKK